MTDSCAARIADAFALIATHFACLNRGEGEAARQHLFHPPSLSDRPLDAYIRDMLIQAPFKLTAIKLLDVQEPRMKGASHGVFGTVWLEVSVESEQMRGTTERLPIWWSPDDGRVLIGARLRFRDWLSAPP